MKWNEWMSDLLFLSFKWLHVPCVSREQRRISNASGGEDQLTGKAESFETYRWWKKSTAPVDDSKSRICYSIVHISTGAGFPPSTVLTQKIWRFHPLKWDFSPHMYPYATGNRVPHALEITSPERLKKGPLFWLYKWLNPTMLNAYGLLPSRRSGFFGGTRYMKLYRSLFRGLFMLLLHHPPFPSWMGMNKPLNMTERAPSTEMAAKHCDMRPGWYTTRLLDSEKNSCEPTMKSSSRISPPAYGEVMIPWQGFQVAKSEKQEGYDEKLPPSMLQELESMIQTRISKIATGEVLAMKNCWNFNSWYGTEWNDPLFCVERIWFFMWKTYPKIEITQNVPSSICDRDLNYIGDGHPTKMESVQWVYKPILFGLRPFANPKTFRHMQTLTFCIILVIIGQGSRYQKEFRCKPHIWG